MSELTDRVARLPWVTRLEVTQPCDGYRWSHMPGKALGDAFLMSRYKCKAPARWQFTALPQSKQVLIAAADGVYCWAHLWSLGLQHNDAELERTRKALDGLKAARKLAAPEKVPVKRRAARDPQQACEYRAFNEAPCGYRVIAVVQVGMRTSDVQRSCAKHLPRTCQTLAYGDNLALDGPPKPVTVIMTGRL